MNFENKPRVLVVDDERANITLMADALKQDFKTIVAKNGHQALERAISDIPPDIILLDIMMPEMDGYEVCRRLKADARTRNIPVIFISAMSEVGDETKGLALGAVDYITKPFNQAIVRARVKTHLESAMAKAKISALLNNSGQGFLSFGRDMMVDSEYSLECKNIFGRAIDNLPINALFYPHDKHHSDQFLKNISRILNESDEYKCQLYISLMPNEFYIEGKHVKAEYKMLEHGKMMMVLTNITEQKALENEIHQERNRLKFIVSSVRESADFFDVIEDFEDFYEVNLQKIFSSDRISIEDLTEIYRHIHTFKGLFQQLEFIYLPGAMIFLENRLAALIKNEATLSVESVRTLFYEAELIHAKMQDLKIIQRALGNDFLVKGNQVTLSQDHALQLESLAKTLLSKKKAYEDEDIMNLLREITRIRYVNFKSLLKAYPKATIQIAKRLGKDIHPFEIEGDDIFVNPDRYSPFTKTLVHIFRNAIDHGIETPDERMAVNKPETATIKCVVSFSLSGLTICIRDDGRGIDINALRTKAIQNGLISDQDHRILNPSMILNLLGTPNLSTKNSISNYSGRGIGLSAVKKMVERMDGKTEITTERNKGTTFHFYLPLTDQYQELWRR